MIFFFKYANFNWQKFSGVSDCCLSLHSVLVKNAKIAFFEENRFLRVVFISLKGRWLQTGLADLKKHQTSVFFLRVDLLRIFENITFFEIFENH